MAQDSTFDVEIVVVSTSGDRDKVTPLHEIGGKGIFVKEVQAAVLDGRADIAVHSAKDMPAVSPNELVLGAVPQRGNPHDVLVGSRLTDLAPEARVATGSVRRRAQLARLRSDLDFHELRGNIATRLAKATDFDAIVMAAVALERLGMFPEIVEEIPAAQMVPQVGQGALAIECRANDEATRTSLQTIDHADSHRVFLCEQAFLRELGGDCSLPAGAHAELVGNELTISGFLASEDLCDSRQQQLSGTDGQALGQQLAMQLRLALPGA